MKTLTTTNYDEHLANVELANKNEEAIVCDYVGYGEEERYINDKANDILSNLTMQYNDM